MPPSCPQEVEEDALVADAGGWRGGTGNMEVMVLEIGLSTGKGHEVYIGAGEVGVIRWSPGLATNL